MKKLFLFTWLMMLSIVTVAQNEQSGNELVIKNGAGTVVERVSATENTEMKFDAKGNKLSIKQDGVTKDISLDEVKTIKSFPVFKLEALNKNVSTSTSPVTLRFELTGNDHGEMKPVSDESIRFTASKGRLASTVTTDDDGVAIADYTPDPSLWEPGFSDMITAIYTFTDVQGRDFRYTSTTSVEYNGDYTIECLSPDQNLGPDEEAEAEFAVYEVSPSGKKPYAGATIEFRGHDGWITPQSAVTDAFGRVRVKFHNYGDDAKEYPVTARFWISGADGLLHTGTAKAKFITLNYKLEAVNPKLAVRNDGSEQFCFFRLSEYHNGEWQPSQKEVEFKLEATNVTLTKTSDMNHFGSAAAFFIVEKSFNQGSVTAKCDIPLKDGKMWQGVATTELVLDDYVFIRTRPVDAVTYINPEESQDVVFYLAKLVNGLLQPCQGMEVSFKCSDSGTLSSTLVKTDANGEATTSFQINKDAFYSIVYVECTFTDEQGIYHNYVEDVEFELIPYRLEAVRNKVAVPNDGSEQSCDFKLYEFDYENRKWEECKKEVTVNFDATGVTLTQTYDENDGHGVTATFTAGKSFQEGSVKADCYIQLRDGSPWHGVATVELVPDDYLFSRILPAESISEITKISEVKFTLTKLVNGQYQGCEGHEVSFECVGGTCSSNSMVTDAKGRAFTLFEINDGTNLASVIASCSFIDENDVYHEYKEIVDFFITPYLLTCLTPEVEMKKSDGKAPIRFKIQQNIKGEWVACPNVKLTFSASNGSASPDYAYTNVYGICQTEFSPSGNATEGTVTGMTEDIVIQFDDGRYIIWSDRKTANITIIDGGGGGGEGPGGGEGEIKDEDLKKADKLDDNTYVVDEKKVTIGSNEEDYVYYYYKTDPESDKSVVCIEFCKEHPVYYTVGGGSVHVTPDMIDKEIDMLKEQPGGMAWMNLFTLKDINQGYNSETNPETSVSAGSTEGNAKLEKAVCKVSKDKDGGYTALMYFKTKDGMEAYAKIKAKIVAPWATN